MDGCLRAWTTPGKIAKLCKLAFHMLRLGGKPPLKEEGMLAPLVLTAHQPAGSVKTRRGPTAPGSPTQDTRAQSGLRPGRDLLNRKDKGEAVIQWINRQGTAAATNPVPLSCSSCNCEI